jgi:hypothetical protein
MITIKEAITKELTAYVKFPFSYIKTTSSWFLPIADELESFDKTKNPAFENAEAYFFLAYKTMKLLDEFRQLSIGAEVNDQQKKVRFGWFDVIDDIEVTKALLEKYMN